MPEETPTEDTNNSPWVIVYLFTALGLFVAILLIVGLVFVATHIAPHVPAF